MVYYNNEQACIIFLKAKNTAYFTLEGYLETKIIKEFIEKVSDLFENEEIKNIIIDSSRLEIIHKDDIKILAKGFNLITRKSSVNPRFAYIRPLSIFGEISLDKLIKETSFTVAKKFNDYDQAESYIYNRQKEKVTNWC